MDDNEDPTHIRMGTFFMVMGGGIFILFVVSDLADKADFDYLFVAMLLIGIGWALRRGKTPPPSAGRFEWWRSTREEANRRKAEKKKDKQEAEKKKHG